MSNYPPGVTGNEPQIAGCPNPEAHEAHMAVNGECPWCGAYNPDQTEFASICEEHGNPDCGLCS